MTNKKNISPPTIALNKIDRVEKHYDTNINNNISNKNIENKIKRDQAMKYDPKPNEIKKIKHVYLTHEECKDLALLKISLGISEKDLLRDFVTSKIKSYNKPSNIS